MDLQAVLAAVKAWPTEDRLELIERVWDGLSTSAGCELSETQKVDLQRRLDAYRDKPKAGSSWEEVKTRLEAKGR